MRLGFFKLDRPLALIRPPRGKTKKDWVWFRAYGSGLEV